MIGRGHSEDTFEGYTECKLNLEGSIGGNSKRIEPIHAIRAGG